MTAFRIRDSFTAREWVAGDYFICRPIPRHRSAIGLNARWPYRVYKAGASESGCALPMKAWRTLTDAKRYVRNLITMETTGRRPE